MPSPSSLIAFDPEWILAVLGIIGLGITMGGIWINQRIKHAMLDGRVTALEENDRKQDREIDEIKHGWTQVLGVLGEIKGFLQGKFGGDTPQNG